MTSGKQGSNLPKEFICKKCGKTFSRIVYISEKGKCTFEFCSRACSNKARKLDPISCPICGKLFIPKINDTGHKRKKYCSSECGNASRRSNDSPKKFPQDYIDKIISLYNIFTAKEIAEILNITVYSVRDILTSRNIVLPIDVAKKRTKNGASQYLKSNNPMRNPKSKEKVKLYWKNHPEEWNMRLEKLNEGKQKIQKSKPTKLEIKLFDILDKLNIKYEPFHLIKPKFIVDALVGEKTIIQADGDYWHGHPRFISLTERQLAQQKRDKAQDIYLTKCGYKVIRIWESDMSIETVKNRLGL